jgi:hypothetical protein
MDWVYGENKKNQSYMVKFMSYKSNTVYPHDRQFTKEGILAIRPGHVRCWLNQLAYHTPMPGPMISLFIIDPEV